MTRYHDEKEKGFRQLFKRRSWVFLGVMLLFYAILAGRFAYLQIYQYEDFVYKAESNRITETALPPQRGVIYDRNGERLAINEPMYSLELIPAKVYRLNNTIDEISKIIEIRPSDRKRFNRMKDELPRLSPVPLKINLTDTEVAKFTAQAWRFPGVEVRSRMHRAYPQGEVAAHVVGYIGRISERDQRQLKERGEDGDYEGTLNIGKSGLELSYESTLHGDPGFEKVEVRASGRPIRTLSKTEPVEGKNLSLSLDMGLQREIYKELNGRRAAVVAIEPKTGEILAFVSSPSFDPNLFVDGIDFDTWDSLNKDPDLPLMNRALQGTYPIGSTYKPFLALAALETKTRDPNKVIQDTGTFTLGNHVFRDSTRGRGYGPVDMKRSIVVSSDVYYYSLAQEMGIDKIHDFMKPWGFGQITGIDLKGEFRGILPSKEWKMRRYKKNWLAGETSSCGIGQGYNNFTILQLAHAVATLANDGVVMKPHLVKKTVDATTGEEKLIASEPVATIPLKKENLALVKSAMHEVTKRGTAARLFQGAEYELAGKTGTAQVLGIKQNAVYDKNKIAERHRDHSLFIAFAPYKNPKIALAILVENGGFGATAAVPLARKILDYYLVEAPAKLKGEENKEESSPKDKSEQKSGKKKSR